MIVSGLFNAVLCATLQLALAPAHIHAIGCGFALSADGYAGVMLAVLPCNASPLIVLVDHDGCSILVQAS